MPRKFRWIEEGPCRHYTEADHRYAHASYRDRWFTLRVEGVGRIACVRTWPEVDRALGEYLEANPFVCDSTPSPYLNTLLGIG